MMSNNNFLSGLLLLSVLALNCIITMAHHDVNVRAIDVDGFKDPQKTVDLVKNVPFKSVCLGWKTNAVRWELSLKSSPDEFEELVDGRVFGGYKFSINETETTPKVVDNQGNVITTKEILVSSDMKSNQSGSSFPKALRCKYTAVEPSIGVNSIKVVFHVFEIEAKQQVNFNETVNDDLSLECTVIAPAKGYEMEVVWHCGLADTKCNETIRAPKYKQMNTPSRTHDDLDQIISVLTIPKAQPIDATNYSCVVYGISAGVSTYAVRKQIAVNRPIEVKSAFIGNKNRVNGEDLTIACDVTGYPVDHIIWYKDDAMVVEGEELGIKPDAAKDQSSGDGKVLLHRVSIETSNGIRNRTLKISKLNFKDSGDYKCVVNGNFTIAERITVKDRYAALWPFLGIVIEVVLLCALIFFCEWRHNKKLELEYVDENNDDEDNVTMPAGAAVGNHGDGTVPAAVEDMNANEEKAHLLNGGGGDVNIRNRKVDNHDDSEQVPDV